MESGSCVRCGMAQGGSCGVRTQGTTIIREREEPMVRWRRGMAHPYQAPHGHGIATPGVHMEIILELTAALPCVKSTVSRTPWKNTWIENLIGRVWKRQRDGKCVGRVMESE